MDNSHSQSHQEEDHWEPIDELPESDEAAIVLPVDAIVAEVVEQQEAAAEQATVVQETVAEYLAAVDDLLNAEQPEAANSGSSSSSSPSHTPPHPSPHHHQRTTRSKLQLRNRLQTARRKLQTTLNVQQTLVQPVARASVQATRRLVTGSRDVRVRDFVAKPRLRQVLDKYVFTCGILLLLTTQYCMLQTPAWFGYYNIVCMVPLLLLRVVLFHQTKQQYFLLDYCYWVNALGFVLTLLPHVLEVWSPTQPEWQTTLHTVLSSRDSRTQQALWQVLFVSAHGPLFFAMIAWNNSLVFHSVDKVTSTAIHIFPALLCYCQRWSVVPDSGSSSSPIYYYDQSNEMGLTVRRHLGYPLLFYAIWQIVYLVQTEYWHKDTLEADPDLATSLKYISSAEKMAINKATLKLCRRVGVMGPTETFHPPTLKVKLIFVLLQMVMTICTFVPVRLLYDYQWLHTSVVVGILAFSVSNGANYYIKVFSKIYEKRYLDHTAPSPEEDYVDTSAVMSEHNKTK